MDYDEFFLSHAFKLARLGRFTATPNPSVGCIIVRNGQIIGRGYHQYAGCAHAEVNALNSAGDKAAGSTAYITLEPCNHHGLTPPCTEALIQAGIVRVVASMADPDPRVAGRGFDCLRKAGIKVRYGLLLSEAEAINPGFLKRMRTGLPLVRLKIAVSLDGRTAMASGESRWITSSESRRDVQIWRAESDAILSTASTILADNPSLTVRWASLPEDIRAIYSQEQLRQPIRVIIDQNNRITPFHKVVNSHGLTWFLRRTTDNLSWPSSVEQIIIPERELSSDTNIDLFALMTELGRRQINSLFVEAGAFLSGNLLDAGLVDELILYQAPKLFGSDARSLCVLQGISCIADAKVLTLIDVRQIGTDIRLRLKPLKLS